jgi:hypothetical protein
VEVGVVGDHEADRATGVGGRHDELAEHAVPQVPDDLLRARRAAPIPPAKEVLALHA